jgi:uncharacterized phage protein gp47/JayE
MPNVLNNLGLQTASQLELQTYYSAAWQAIYGSNIDLSPPSPDGQLLNILVQANLDIEDLLSQIYASFDPNQAVGVQLDSRCAINGVQRQAGSFTIQNVTVVTSQSVTLYGLDQTAQTPFTVADNAGNQYQLQTTQNISGAGSNSYSFQCTVTGAIQSSPNTITIQITTVVAVTSVNNPTSYTSLGIAQETDQALRLRRMKSVQQPSQGYFNALYAALSNVIGVTSVFLHENLGGTTDVNGVPGHSIWAIVQGGANKDIANAIYFKRNAGCGMKGSVAVNIPQADESTFTVFFDRVTAQNLYIQFTATSINGINQPNLQAILTQLPILFVPGVGQEVNINMLATIIQQIDPNTLVTNAGLSLSSLGPFTSTLSPSSLANQLVALQQNITALAIQILPYNTTVTHLTTQQFTAFGGTQTGYVWSLSVNNSGGSINSSTGVYTAGSTFNVTDSVTVTDSGSNTQTVVVTVN